MLSPKLVYLGSLSKGLFASARFPVLRGFPRNFGHGVLASGTLVRNAVKLYDPVGPYKIPCGPGAKAA